MHCGDRSLLCEVSIIHSHSRSYSARPCLRALPSNPTGLSTSLLFAEVAVHTYLKTCQCLDALPGNPCAPVYLALVGYTVLASSF